MPQAIALAMTGASGSQYGLRLLQCLLQARQQVYLMLSEPARLVINTETELKIPAQPNDIQNLFTDLYHAAPGQLEVFGKQEWFAPVASGSNPPKALVICPCTSGTLAAVACGLSRSLIERAADVVLKEGRQLILVHRETPLSVIHLENMLRLARMGAVILPANPGFYHQPHGIEGLIDFIVARILDQLQIEHTLLQRWGCTL
jgi:4-hydroxy-3-polyprenylbenzoate decarboxylase